MKTAELSTAERLIVARRRAGESQAAAAERLGVTDYRYRRLEAGRETPATPAERPALGKLLDHEACFVHRRRAGLTLGELAEATGYCEAWLSQMERGAADARPLLDHWATC